MEGATGGTYHLDGSAPSSAYVNEFVSSEDGVRLIKARATPAPSAASAAQLVALPVHLGLPILVFLNHGAVIEAQESGGPASGNNSFDHLLIPAKYLQDHSSELRNRRKPRCPRCPGFLGKMRTPGVESHPRTRIPLCSLMI